MERTCEWCVEDISHKRRDARFCDRACKNKATQERLRARTTPEERSELNRERYLRERDRRLEQARAYYWSTAEFRRDYSKAWRKSNPDKRRAQQLKRTAQMKGAESRVVTSGDLTHIINIQQGRCYYCQAETDLVFDHVMPLAKGGRHSIGNLVGACAHCNSQKSAMLLIEWRHFLLRKGVSLTL